MTADQLFLISSWASIASFAVSIASLLYLRSIKANIVRFRRKQRLRELTTSVANTWPSTISKAELDSMLASLRRNFPLRPWSKFTVRGRLVIELHQRINAGDLLWIKDILKDLNSFSGDA